MGWTGSRATDLLSGDEATFDQFVHDVWPEAFRISLLILGNRQDAQEVVQDALMILHKNRSRIHDPAKLKAWFYQVLTRCATRSRRHSTRRKTQPLPQFDIDPGQVDEAQNVDTHLTIMEALKRLSTNERLTLILSYYCDQTDEKAAAMAGWRLGTYKWRKARALRNMERMLHGLMITHLTVQKEGAVRAE